MSRIADPRDILMAPVISEKSYGLLDENKYTFEVRTDANKTQIRQAVESVFGRITDPDRPSAVPVVRWWRVGASRRESRTAEGEVTRPALRRCRSAHPRRG